MHISVKGRSLASGHSSLSDMLYQQQLLSLVGLDVIVHLSCSIRSPLAHISWNSSCEIGLIAPNRTSRSPCCSHPSPPPHQAKLLPRSPFHLLSQDLWRLDLTTNVWEQLNLKGGPSPRSGHRMVLYKHKLFVFGGFYDTLREVRYFDDLHVLDLDEMKWTEVKQKPGGIAPSPRSAFQVRVGFCGLELT